MGKTFEDIKQLKKEYEKAVSEFGKEALAEAFKPIFAEHPTVISFEWRQYTPFFNDGDVCSFSVHGDYPEIQFEGDEDREEVPYKCEDPSRKAADDAIGDAISGVPEDIMLAVFGDHCKVVATRDGFEVEEYDHD